MKNVARFLLRTLLFAAALSTSGCAIVGAARGDIYFGAGDAAGYIAGLVRHDVDFYVLRPRESPR